MKVRKVSKAAKDKDGHYSNWNNLAEGPSRRLIEKHCTCETTELGFELPLLRNVI